MSKTIYQISEYGSFITGRQIEGYTTLPPTIFERLENFILSSKNVSSTHTFHKFFGTSSDTNALELMGISFRKEIGKIITVSVLLHSMMALPLKSYQRLSLTRKKAIKKSKNL